MCPFSLPSQCQVQRQAQPCPVVYMTDRFPDSVLVLVWQQMKSSFIKPLESLTASLFTAFVFQFFKLAYKVVGFTTALSHTHTLSLFVPHPFSLLLVSFLPNYPVFFSHATYIQSPSFFSLSLFFLSELPTAHCHLPSLLDPLSHTFSLKSKICVVKARNLWFFFFFRIRLIPLNIMASSLIHFPANVMIPFSSQQTIIIHMDHLSLSFHPVGGRTLRLHPCLSYCGHMDMEGSL